MKVPREARRLSRQIFHACMVDGHLDEAGMRRVVRLLAEKKPRHYIHVLHRLRELVEKEVDHRTFSVTSATPLPDSGVAIFHELEKRFGLPLTTRYRTNPELIGGVRIRVGSNVWDGSVRERILSLGKAA